MPLSWRQPRQRLILAASLDAIGVFALAHHFSHGTALMVTAAFLLFGWLFGSYTLLRWPWLRLRLVLLRIMLPCLATLGLLIFSSWILGFDSQRDQQLFLFGSLVAWSLVVRLTLRYLLRWAPDQHWPLLAEAEEGLQVSREWQRHPFLPVRPPQLISPSALLGGTPPLSPGGVVLGRGLRLEPDQEQRLNDLQAQGLSTTTVLQLAEAQLERLPPSLLPSEWLAMTEIPWANTFSVQRQLKRAADVVLSFGLLVAAAPLLLLASLAIWIEDRGPIFYCQRRSGWLGRPFSLLKLRTMAVEASHSAPSPWTRPRDSRITRVGFLLRRVRIDELPQLINVLRGEMSLIGPRPEQPDLELELEQSIAHYRKRHWMRPGLSGWAQVCAPYASSVDEAELKLSYDLYYLRHWSTGLDLLVLFKTIKTVLQAGGR
jgi:lipopolysaccharide/colanic/teichoic acid biosynthesis glycosyltransferase